MVNAQYPKNCGIIDTLEQELCIENENFCPYIGIGEISKALSKYIYNSTTNIYYNNYNNTGQKIIGKLILNKLVIDYGENFMKMKLMMAI